MNENQPGAGVGETDRTRIRRLPDRASQSREDLYSILDANQIAHVAIAVEGVPHILPMAYARIDDHLYLHGSTGSRLMRALADDLEVCVAVTEYNGIKVARSTFNSGMGYRSAVIYGRFEDVSDTEKDTALNALSDVLVPGRSREVRPSNKRELAATRILRLSITEAAVKISAGQVEDEPEDLGTGVWAGFVPIERQYGTPIPADAETATLPIPASVQQLLNRRP